MKLAPSLEEVDWELAAREMGIPETSEQPGYVAKLLFEQHLRRLKDALDAQFPLWYLE